MQYIDRYVVRYVEGGPEPPTSTQMRYELDVILPWAAENPAMVPERTLPAALRAWGIPPEQAWYALARSGPGMLYVSTFLAMGVEYWTKEEKEE